MKEASKLKVLVTNDDGIESEMMLSLASALCEICDVTVVVPDSQKSGVSHAFTAAVGLKVSKFDAKKFPIYTVSGNPVDAVKFAVSEGLCGTLPDIVISGINPGENSGVSSIYSGTVGGAREGALWGIPSIAISLRGVKGDNLENAIDFAKRVVAERLFEGMPKATFWNVNFPKANVPYKGVTVARMCLDMFTDHYEVRDGLHYLEGSKDFANAPLGSDDRALAEGFAVITPHKLDQTSDTEFERLLSLKLNVNENA